MFDAATRRSVGNVVARGRLRSWKKRTAFEGMENSLGLKLNSAWSCKLCNSALLPKTPWFSIICSRSGRLWCLIGRWWNLINSMNPDWLHIRFDLSDIQERILWNTIFSDDKDFLPLYTYSLEWWNPSLAKKLGWVICRGCGGTPVWQIIWLQSQKHRYSLPLVLWRLEIFYIVKPSLRNYRMNMSGWSGEITKAKETSTMDHVMPKTGRI